MSGLIHQFSAWYLSVLGQGGYLLIAALMALESTLVPIPSEVIIPPAAYLAHTQGQLTLAGIILAGALGSFAGATVMYYGARWLGRPLVVRFGRYVGLGAAKLELAEAWLRGYGWPGVFFSRLLPVIRHLIGIPVGVLRMPFRWYALATLAGSLLWTAVLAELGESVGAHPEVLAGDLRRFFALVVAVGVVLAILYYAFVLRATRHASSR